MLKVTSQLDDEVEALIHRVIGYCIRVHRELGPGLLERIYRRAVCIELQSEGVPFEVEKSFAGRTTSNSPLMCLSCSRAFCGGVCRFRDFVAVIGSDLCG